MEDENNLFIIDDELSILIPEEMGIECIYCGNNKLKVEAYLNNYPCFKVFYSHIVCSRCRSCGPEVSISISQLFNAPLDMIREAIVENTVFKTIRAHDTHGQLNRLHYIEWGRTHGHQ